MDRLAATLELLDGPLDDPEGLIGNLRDLGRINQLLGGTALSLRTVERLVGREGGSDLCILDVGTGGGDIALDLARGDGLGRHVEVVAVDNRPEVLDAARMLDPRLRDHHRLRLELADGRDLPYPDGSFDVAHASLVMHHLEPPEAVRFLSELRRVSRRGVVVNDLVRGRVFWAFAWAGARLLTRNRLTRHDAPLSVRRAYSVEELHGLLAAAGLRARHLAIGPLGHRVAIAAVASAP
jgi:SAM-dependent methyltransferase